MRPNEWAVTMLAAALAASATGEQPMINGKPDLSGKWQAESKGSQTWVIEQAPDSVSILELTSADKTQTDVRCGLNGKECSGRVNGEDAKVVFYFNGPMLVQITTQGKNVSKTRRTLSEDGQRITVEYIPLVPEGKPETRVLVRAQTSESQSAAQL